MRTYHKIQAVFKRDQRTGKVIAGEYSLPEFEFLKENTWVFTEKIDGTNVRIIWDGRNIEIGGKTDKAQLPTFLYKKLSELFGNRKEEFADLFGSNEPIPDFPGDGPDELVTMSEYHGVCLYGEGYGARIQKMGVNYIPKGVDFILIDIKIGHWWLERHDVEDIASKLGLNVVPIIGEGTLPDMIGKTRTGFKSRWGDFIAEGIVARPKLELKTRKGERLITKIKHGDFER